MSICRTVHRAPLLRQSRPLLTLRAQKADHYKLHVRTEMRSGQYAAPREDADAGRGSRRFDPRLLPEAWSPEADARRSRSKGSQQPVRPHIRRGGDPRLQNAFKAALKGPRSVRRPRKKRAMFSISVAKYRPHRLHRLQCGSLQSFLAGDATGVIDRSRKYRPRSGTWKTAV